MNAAPTSGLRTPQAVVGLRTPQAVVVECFRKRPLRPPAAVLSRAADLHEWVAQQMCLDASDLRLICGGRELAGDDQLPASDDAAAPARLFALVKAGGSGSTSLDGVLKFKDVSGMAMQQQLAGEQVQVRDHEQQALGAGEGGAERAAREGAVQRAQIGRASCRERV